MKKKLTEENIRNLAQKITKGISKKLTIDDLADSLKERKNARKDLFLASLSVKQRELYDTYLDAEQIYKEFMETFSRCLKD